ncbi:histone-lysine_N-methyltransferase 2A-like isoform X2 [Hexamita inflata]|uniref:Histone-lysine_N-methyltransferase 2A-like isoform X2 n=1 Tax=Hexamita inflata TaxID=28002 RepID=A0ABP1I2X4_9EUKA
MTFQQSDETAMILFVDTAISTLGLNIQMLKPKEKQQQVYQHIQSMDKKQQQMLWGEMAYYLNKEQTKIENYYETTFKQSVMNNQQPSYNLYDNRMNEPKNNLNMVNQQILQQQSLQTTMNIPPQQQTFQMASLLQPQQQTRRQLAIPEPSIYQVYEQPPDKRQMQMPPPIIQLPQLPPSLPQFPPMQPTYVQPPNQNKGIVRAQKPMTIQQDYDDDTNLEQNPYNTFIFQDKKITQNVNKPKQGIQINNSAPEMHIPLQAPAPSSLNPQNQQKLNSSSSFARQNQIPNDNEPVTKKRKNASMDADDNSQRQQQLQINQEQFEQIRQQFRGELTRLRAESKFTNEAEVMEAARNVYTNLLNELVQQSGSARSFETDFSQPVMKQEPIKNEPKYEQMYDIPKIEPIPLQAPKPERKQREPKQEPKLEPVPEPINMITYHSDPDPVPEPKQEAISKSEGLTQEQIAQFRVSLIKVAYQFNCVDCEGFNDQKLCEQIEIMERNHIYGIWITASSFVSGSNPRQLGDYYKNVFRVNAYRDQAPAAVVKTAPPVVVPQKPAPVPKIQSPPQQNLSQLKPEDVLQIRNYTIYAIQHGLTFAQIVKEIMTGYGERKVNEAEVIDVVN